MRGCFADLPKAESRMVKLADEPLMPRPSTAALYDEAYGAYRRLFDEVEAALGRDHPTAPAGL
jgi:hypothetical protein